MAHYIITGGAGFIGSNLTKALLEKGHQVTILDHYRSHSTTNTDPRADVVQGDIRDREKLYDVFKGKDGIFHLADRASVQRSLQDWEEAHFDNFLTPLLVFEAAASANPKPIPVVYASSAGVYGDRKEEEMPLHETLHPRPIANYTADKVGCEMYAHVAGHLFNLPTMGLRIFQPYGKAQYSSKKSGSGVISIIADLMKQEKTITLFGDGKQIRDFIYIDDISRFFMAAMEKTDISAPVVNVCSGAPVTLLELTSLISKILNKEPKIDFQPERKGDIYYSYGDPSLAEKILGVKAEVSLEDGLKKYLLEKE